MVTIDGKDPVARELEKLHGQKGKYANAVVLSAYATTTPLGMFRTRALVAPANWYANVWTVIHGVLSAVLITLFILAIRRRFKLQS